LEEETLPEADEAWFIESRTTTSGGFLLFFSQGCLQSESGEDGFMQSIFVLCQWVLLLSVNVSCFCFGLFLRLLFWNGLRQTLSTIDKI
jgi:hypothetical protein